MRYLPLMLCCLLTTGCAVNEKGRHPQGASPDVNEEVARGLLGVAQSIEQSLGTLALNQETNNPPLINTAPLITPEGGMGGKADIDWSGPIEPLLEKIALMSDYQVKLLGNPPAIPIIVTVHQRGAVIADILKNASLQAGKRANVMVFPASRVIEIRYRSG